MEIHFVEAFKQTKIDAKTDFFSASCGLFWSAKQTFDGSKKVRIYNLEELIPFLKWLLI
jgi:hypothetical protein